MWPGAGGEGESNASKKNNYIKPATFSSYWQHKSMLTCFKEWDLQAICSYSARCYYDKQLQLPLASRWGFQSQLTHTSLGESYRTSCLHCGFVFSPFHIHSCNSAHSISHVVVSNFHFSWWIAMRYLTKRQPLQRGLLFSAAFRWLKNQICFLRVKICRALTNKIYFVVTK